MNQNAALEGRVMRYCETESKSLMSELQALKREKIAQAAKAYAKAKAEGTIRVVDQQGLNLVPSR